MWRQIVPRDAHPRVVADVPGHVPDPQEAEILEIDGSSGDRRRISTVPGWTACLLLLRKLGRRRTSAVIVLGLLGLTGSIALGLARGVPIPAIHDEFSYLLAAETFSEGRLTNPTHDHWEHFETFHVIQRPTYQSKYPPGQGMLLAVGQVLAGHPVAGVWLGAGLMAAAVAWALLIWLPPSWAVLAGIFCTVQLSWFSYWSQSYWGGTVAAIGGALCLGSYRALTSRPRFRHGIILGVGLGLLAFSRPFEGLLVGGLAVAALAWQLFRVERPQMEALLFRGLGPAAMVSAVMLGALGVYNHQVTGSAFTMPYQVHEQQYGAAPALLFQAPGSLPEYRHAEMERYWMEWGRQRHEWQRSLEGLPRRLMEKAGGLLWFFLGVGVVAVLGLLDSGRLRSEKLALVGLGAVLAAALSTKGGYAHYVAPATVLFFIVMGRGFQGLHRRARRKRILNLGPFIVAAFLVLASLGAARFLDSDPAPFMVRHTISNMLGEMPGDHLVLVVYGEGHDYHREWVYNRADIDAARIVWARSMDPARDDELRAYYPDRTHWTLSVDQREIQLTPLASAEPPEGGDP